MGILKRIFKKNNSILLKRWVVFYISHQKSVAWTLFLSEIIHNKLNLHICQNPPNIKKSDILKSLLNFNDNYNFFVI